ncbi:MAG: hypothetical protein HC881_16160 [Leptolyngbyaceae cyanobacterium SL_7_1]|nr:hypothetical protein [Leptolyngbyaceae cyanobacterium SL_7_1]
MGRWMIVSSSLLGIVATTAGLAGAATELQVVDSAALGTSRRLPWSEPVQVNDPFEGNFIGGFDRNYFYDRLLNTSTRIEVQSLWTPETVRFLLITRDRVGQETVEAWKTV